MGYEASIGLRSPSWSQAHRQPISHQNNLKKMARQAQIQSSIYTFIYIRIFTSEKNSSGDRKQAGLGLLPSAHSRVKAQGPEGAVKWEGRGALCTRRLSGGRGHLCIERRCVQREAWGRSAQWLQEQMPKGRAGGRVGCWARGRGWSHDPHPPAPQAAVSLQRVATGLP